MTGRVYTIAAGQNFSKIFAQYLLEKTQSCPEELVRYRIFLPTRRACRILRDAFLQLNDGKPLLLPFMCPIGEVDDQDLSLMMYGNEDGTINIPDAIPQLQRQLMLSKLIQSMPDYMQGADHALNLAKSLCQFIDDVLVEELEFDSLEDLVPSDFAGHWQVTIDFLKIITQHWPDILKENNVVEAVERRRILLDHLGQCWLEAPPSVPVYAVGVTGSIPAVRRFLNVVSKLPQGCVVLPGLDQNVEDDVWNSLGESHPQYVLKQTLSMLGVERHSVLPIGSTSSIRSSLADIMMLPAAVTERWSSLDASEVLGALEGLQYYECQSQDQEAALISVLLRETLEDRTKVCAFVTPDRKLARRVAAVCKRWKIDVDDSAGQSLIENDLGKFALLILNAVDQGYNPVSLLSLMKSPLFRLGREKAECRRLVSLLERSVLRQGYIIHSFEDLREHIEDEGLLAFFDDFYALLKTLAVAENDFHSFLQTHIHIMEQMAATADQDGASRLWRGDAGESASRLLSDMLEHGHLIGSVPIGEYSKIFRVLFQGVQVRSAYGVHPRLLILGQLEARLTHADRIIMGGLNEGSWTSVNDHDPWMSVPMRKRFGLPGVDQSVGISAHDFVQGFCASDVILTRSKKIDRGPSIPVRWLSRLETVLKTCDLTLTHLTRPEYFHWLDALDNHGGFRPYMRPEPRPPSEARPRGVSVTKVETWLQNPYAVYAYYVLGLREEKPIIQDNDAALRGQLIHEIIDRYMRGYSEHQTFDRFIEIAKDVSAQNVSDDTMLNYWWPKIYSIAEWFVQHEKSWSERSKFLCSEARGKVSLNIDGIPFYLEARADRIDRMSGGYALIDYKSGGDYSLTKLKNGSFPQLPLEALMIEHSGFEGVERAPSCYLGYWILKGGDIGGKVVALEEGIDETVRIVEHGLSDLVSTFRDETVPFYCIPDFSNVPRYNDYALLARVKEWATLGNEEQGESA